MNKHKSNCSAYLEFKRFLREFKDSSKNQILNNKQKPSAKALQFVLDYAKSASMIKTKALDSFVFIAN